MKDIKVNETHLSLLWNLKFSKKLKSMDEVICYLIQFYEKNNQLKGHKDIK